MTCEISTAGGLFCINGEPITRIIQDQLLPFGIFLIEIAVVIFILSAAFTVIYHHVELARWRRSDDDDDADVAGEAS